MPNPPAIDRAMMQHLAELARLHIPAEQLGPLRQRLESIVSAFSALQDPDLAPAAASAAPPELQLSLRPDLAGEPLPVSTVLANAPQHAASAFVVPRVIDA
jgi:aspartyl-tRNA(Asn)/glutamyl-tRNA(Gln) amidotransferase subunit C